jgi:hypothetical protein
MLFCFYHFLKCYKDGKIADVLLFILFCIHKKMKCPSCFETLVASSAIALFAILLLENNVLTILNKRSLFFFSVLSLSKSVSMTFLFLVFRD